MGTFNFKSLLYNKTYFQKKTQKLTTRQTPLPCGASIGKIFSLLSTPPHALPQKLFGQKGEKMKNSARESRRSRNVWLGNSCAEGDRVLSSPYFQLPPYRKRRGEAGQRERKKIRFPLLCCVALCFWAQWMERRRRVRHTNAKKRRKEKRGGHSSYSFIFLVLVSPGKRFDKKYWGKLKKSIWMQIRKLLRKNFCF